MNNTKSTPCETSQGVIKKWLHRHRWDITLALVLLLTAAVWLILRGVLSQPGEYVTVEVDGSAVQVYDLSIDGEYRIDTPYGYNIIKIADGTVSVIDADCPDKLGKKGCVRQRSIRMDGETIVCLPHRLSVTVTSDKKSDVDM